MIYTKQLFIILIIMVSLLPDRIGADQVDSYTKEELSFLFTAKNLHQPPPVATSSYPADKWGKYSAQSAFDNNIETSWVEGADGQGTGEKILFIVPEGTSGFQILPGYGKKSVFKVNNRVKDIRMQFYYATYEWQDSWEKSLCNLESVHSFYFTFQDTMALQEINIGENLYIKEKYHTHILGLLEILSVYTGRDNDTCIAEIRFTYGDDDTAIVNTEQVVDNESLAGVWQDSPMMASGWGDTFQFGRNMTFAFYYNQMDCAKRDLSFSGTWKVNGDTLILEIKKKTHIVGGRFEEAAGSCASDKILVGGDIVTSDVIPVDIKTYSISRITIEDTYNIGIAYPYIEIDGKSYWQFDSDPDYYTPNNSLGQTRP